MTRLDAAGRRHQILAAVLGDDGFMVHPYFADDDVRFETSMVMQGAAELLTCGTAVVVRDE